MQLNLSLGILHTTANTKDIKKVFCCVKCSTLLQTTNLPSGKASQDSQFQNLNANFAQIFFRVYHNHRYKSWDMIIKIWIHIENVYHWAMSILISECQFCTNIFRFQILLGIFTSLYFRILRQNFPTPPKYFFWYGCIYIF